MPDCKSSRATLQRASEASFTKQAMSCGHLKQAKNYKELLKSFSAIARYSLLYRNKQSLRINKKGKELRALLKVDNPEGEMNNSSSSQQQQVVSTAQQKKKALQASGMERVVASVEKLPTPKCTDCNDIMASARLHCCLECIHIGCYGTHMNKHYESTKHQFYMDFVHCNVYCCECRDYVYSADFDARIEKEEFHLHYISTRIREPFSAHAYHSTWIPTTNEKQLISLKYTPSKCTGVRGLQNMGSTCFMNTILQTMIHNPMIRAYFLSEKHVTGSCAREAAVCMACQLDTIFQNFSGQSTVPFTPHASLYAMWMSQKHLSGYSQQDAHEYFISLLDEVHKNCKETKSHSCGCIIHYAFGGLLQSDLTCTACGTVSLTHDPFLDLSLEIRSSNVKPPASKKKKVQSDGTIVAVADTEPVTLQECLEEYTIPEKLSLSQYSCKSCSQSVVKQLSFKQLPPILSIQLKRFEHSATSSSKIETRVKIPLFLDMTPHTTRSVKVRSILNKSGLKRLSGRSQNEFAEDGIPNYQYNLFAVVCHQGKIDTGHYKSYCKVRDQWFLFDDQVVTRVEEDEVIGCEVYMCFYGREHLDYTSESFA